MPARSSIVEARHPGDVRGVLDPLPQVERALVLRGGLGERVHALGRDRRPRAGRERAAVVAGGVPVTGDRGGRRGDRVSAERGPLGQHAGARGVEAAPLAGQQLVVRGLAGQLVAEAQPPVARVGDEHVMRDGFPQRVRELGTRHERGEQLVVDERTGDGGRADGVLGRGRKGGDAGVQHVAHGDGQAARVAFGRSRQQLLGEERVAAGPAGDLGDGGQCRRGAEDRGAQVRDLVGRERRQLDAVDGADAGELGQPASQRGPARHFVGAVGADEHDARVIERAGEEAGEVERRAVGPVDVLEHEHERRRGRRLQQQLVQLPEQASP